MSIDIATAMSKRRGDRRRQRCAFLLNPYVLAAASGPTGVGTSRYYRIDGLTVADTLVFEISEIQLLVGGSVVSGGCTVTSNFTPNTGSPSALVDGNLGNRCTWVNNDAEDPSFYIQFDLGSAQAVDGVKQAGYDTADRYMAAFTLRRANSSGGPYGIVGSKSGLSYPGNNTLSSAYSFP